MTSRSYTEAAPGAPPLDRILFDSPLVRIGAFRAPVDHPRFRDSGPIERHVFVFPRTSVMIEHEGHRPFVTDLRTVTFYNAGQRYTRRPIDPRGDRCEWFSVREDVLRGILAHHDPGASDRDDGVFAFQRGPSDAGSYTVQRLVVRHVLEADPPDPMLVEEAVLGVLDRIVAAACRGVGRDEGYRRGPGGRPSLVTRQVRAYLVERYARSFTLEDVAEAVGASVSHMCRVFKRDLGTTIHRYREDLRLRRALELIPGSDDLTGVALELGYSSHSHLTASFRRMFSMTPSRFRASVTGRRLRELTAGPA